MQHDGPLVDKKCFEEAYAPGGFAPWDSGQVEEPGRSTPEAAQHQDAASFAEGLMNCGP